MPSRSHLKMRPDGHIAASGAEYRLEERDQPGWIEVIRESDGLVMGRFAPSTVGKREKPDVAPDSVDPSLVRAIAKLLAAPRGALPIQ
jgi:hypothetical protein